LTLCSLTFIQGERPDAYFALLSGKLSIYRDREVTQILDEKNEGSTIGESLFFTDGFYPYNCCAVVDTTVVTVPLDAGTRKNREKRTKTKKGSKEGRQKHRWMKGDL
jgi:hypothetical protein